ncbi:MAG TPA: flagellar type III secretion system pore protein FliP [Symbiobacteriaceae bacterium]|nr:flagellar type III secretion system pore protein FliP [Symbiobacteriaceae bacterium]
MRRRLAFGRPLLAAVLLLLCLVLFGAVATAVAAPEDPAVPLPTVNIGVGQSQNPRDVVSSLQIIGLLTILSLAPSILVLMTAFTRIVVVLSFTRSALATQNQPPNQVLVGLALFLTFFVMAPTFNTINSQALQPYLRGEINQAEALTKGTEPLREFMLKQTNEKDLALFVNLAGLPRPNTPADLPTYVIIPAFAVSEIATAFKIGFLIYIPFIVIDMVISATLMSMGMLMLPPMMISLPFKILLFIMMDGWRLVVQYLVQSFR